MMSILDRLSYFQQLKTPGYDSKKIITFKILSLLTIFFP